MSPSTVLEDKFIGTFIGLSLGDALGAPYEGGFIERFLWKFFSKTPTGKMRWTDDTQMSIDLAESILEKNKIVLPDKVITSETFEGKNIKKKSLDEIEDNEMILDLLLKEETYSILDSAKTILWNGPMGVFENKLFEQGTRDLSETIAKSSAFSIAGGGETLSAINKYINTDDVSYCSTGGGAFLEFMEGKTLPSISALNAKNTER